MWWWFAVLACGEPTGHVAGDAVQIRSVSGAVAMLRRGPAGRGAPRLRALHLGERTTCVEDEAGAFRCFGALPAHGASTGALQVSDHEVCTSDGLRRQCHRAGGHVHDVASPFVEVHRGGVPCGRDAEGGVWCWSPRAPEHDRPLVAIPIAGTAVAMAAGGLDTCVLTDAGEVQCFDAMMYVYGYPRPLKRAARGAVQLGGTYLQRCWSDPRGVGCGEGGRRWRVPRIRQARLLAVGLRHGCAVDGARVRCWGSNRHGQRQPPPLDGDMVLDLAAGDDHTCALLFGGTLSCWGRDDQGQVTGPCSADLCGS